MAHDRDDFRRRPAEARSGAFGKGDDEGLEVAGHLALAYAALARRRGTPPTAVTPDAADAVAISADDPQPLMLRD